MGRTDAAQDAEREALRELMDEIGRPKSETTPIPEVIMLYASACKESERARLAELVRGMDAQYLSGIYRLRKVDVLRLLAGESPE